MSNLPQNKIVTDTLKELGIAENDAILYEILLKNPGLSIKELQKLSPFSRTMLYYVIESLEGWELVETKKDGKKTVYLAAPPEKLEGFISDQEKEFARQKKMLSEVMVDLKSEYRLAYHKPGVKFYEGLEGIREVTFDSLKSQGEILTFLDVDATQKYIADINKEYVAERVKRQISKKQIAVDTPFTRERYQKYSPLLEVRLIPPELKPFKTSVQIYNNTISFSTLNDKKMIGVIIEDEHIAQLHRSLFEYIWKTLPPLTVKKLPENSMYNIPKPPIAPPAPAAGEPI